MTKIRGCDSYYSGKKQYLVVEITEKCVVLTYKDYTRICVTFSQARKLGQAIYDVVHQYSDHRTIRAKFGDSIRVYAHKNVTLKMCGPFIASDFVMTRAAARKLQILLGVNDA